MSVAHLLPDFSNAIGVPSSVTVSSAEIDDLRLQAFENGFNSGWEDAARAKADEQASIGAELARNIADLGFTYQEAYGSVMNSMRPLIEQLVGVVLPQLAHETLGMRLVEELQAIARQVGQVPVQVATSDSDYDTMAAVLPPETAVPVELVRDASLAPGQLDLRFGDSEQTIDLSAVITGIESATQDYFTEQLKDVANG